MSEQEYLFGFTPRRWRVGKAVIGNGAALVSHLRVYGEERVPLEGGLVLAVNHMSFLDPPAVGHAMPRRIYYMAKAELHAIPGMAQLIRFFGTFAVKRGASDRDAVRMMREVVRRGEALGVFVEGTRQKTGEPGVAMPGAAMVALQEQVPVLPVAIRGSNGWRPWNLKPVEIAIGEPMRFDELPANGKGYKEATAQIEAEIRRLFDWLGEMRAAGRPRTATPPPRER
jgi:1-acyl-sn-glycerol-3-phosphate acyltransferase